MYILIKRDKAIMQNENSIKLLTGASDISISIYALLYPVNVNGSTGRAL